MLADDELGPPENILMHYSAEGKTNEGKGEDERTKGMDGRGRRKGGKLKFQSSVFSANTPPPLPNSSPSALDLRSFTMRGAALFSSVMNGRYTCYGGYISRTRRHCNFPRHRHRYHELVIDAFHYSRGDDSTETAAYRSSGGGGEEEEKRTFPPRETFFYFIFHDCGSFPEGKTKIRVDRIGYGGRRGVKEGERKGKSKEMKRGNVCRSTSYNLWRMRDGMKINKVR